jgi:hypothetical protein
VASPAISCGNSSAKGPDCFRPALAQGREGKRPTLAPDRQNVGNGLTHRLRLRPIRATLGVPRKAWSNGRGEQALGSPRTFFHNVVSKLFWRWAAY